MILNIGAGKARDKVPPLFSVTGGTYRYAQSVAADGKVNWEIALLSGSNATLNFQRVVDAVDVFLVGGGRSAGAGNGANGGQRLTATGVSVSSGTNYAFTVGGSNGSTSIFGRTANSGSGSSGGIGGMNGGSTKGGDGAYAFGASSSLVFSGRKYGAGGGGGGVNRRVAGGYSAGAGGGETGGGAGSSQPTTSGVAGTANTGGGGGGGFYDEYTYTASAGGAGGSGIIIIRNAR